MPYKDSKKQSYSQKRYYERNKEKRIAYGRKYAKEHPEKIRKWANDWFKKNYRENEEFRKRRLAYHKNYYKNNPRLSDGYNLRTRYGITVNDYDILLEKQNNSCAICGKHVSKLSRRLSVDHCHESNKIRGLLCSNCNFGIGYMQESTEIMERAINYLKKNKYDEYKD